MRFVSEAVELASPIGRLRLGVVDPEEPGVAEGVSRLLNRSIQDARASHGGHLPEWLVDDIERNYISVAKVKSLWAPVGDRFCVVTEADEIIGTIHIARSPAMILTVDRWRINVPATEFPGFKPDGMHHVVNISVKHEVRRLKVGSLMVDGIVARFRGRFAGDGLWVRADPPWHPGLVGLGFGHDPAKDVFLPGSVERTAGLPHDAFNARYACTCAGWDAPERARRMREDKLQYVCMTRPFAAGGARVAVGAAVAAGAEAGAAVGAAVVARDDGDAAAVACDDGDAAAAAPDERGAGAGGRGASAPAASQDRGDAVLARGGEQGGAPARDGDVTRDYGGGVRRVPREVVRPATVPALAAAIRGAPGRVVLRGAGYSYAGQALADGARVVRMDALDRVLAWHADRVVVEGGAILGEVVRAALARGRVLPVVPSTTAMTVGGVLAGGGGLGRGSHARGLLADHVRELVVVTGDGRTIACSSTQAAWLFEAALGGWGRFGAIARATLALVPAPALGRVQRETREVDAAGLAAALADTDGLLAIAARASAADRYRVTRAWAADSGPAALADFLAPPPPPPLAAPRWLLQLRVSPAALPATLAQVATVPHDSLVVHPLVTASRALLAPAFAGFVVSLVVPALPRELPAGATLQCGLPETLEGWRAYLGDAQLAAFERARRLADPDGRF